LYVLVNIWPAQSKQKPIPLARLKTPIKDTGALIEAARKERGWSQSDLGDRLGGVDRRQISAMENGNPSVDFGLVVSALWLLNVPILANLAYPDMSSSVTRNYNLMKQSVAGRLQSSKAKEKHTEYRLEVVRAPPVRSLGSGEG